MIAGKVRDIPRRTNKPIVETALTKVGRNSELIFRCIFDKSVEDVFYKIYWYVDNKYLSSSKPHRWEDRGGSNDLDETTLKEKGFKTVGFNVYCGVRASFQTESAASLPIFSQVKYVGIKLYNTTVYLDKEPVEIFFQLTAPFGCIDDKDCSLEIQLLERDDIQDNNCERKNLVASYCGVSVEKSKWDKVHSFVIKRRTTVNKNTKTTSTSIMKLTTSQRNWNHGLWANYNDFGNVLIETREDTSMIQGKQCHAVCDPHMKTLDGRYYEHQYGGIFTLYTNVELQVEVQVETALCNSNRAFCVCGLAVRAGRSVFAIPLCHGFKRPGFLLCDDVDDVLDVRRRTDQQYEILIPSGAIVKANLLNYGGYFMNVYVVPSVHDVDKSRGLCGKLSNTRRDDFVKRDGTQSGPGRDFSASWRVQDQNNLFDRNKFDRLERWDRSWNYCNCPKCLKPPCGEVECGPMQEANACFKYRPPATDSVKPDPRRCSIHARKRRSVFEPSTTSHQMMSINKRDADDWLNGWTKENATVFCEKQLRSLSSTQTCQNIPTVNISQNIEDCVFDIWASGSTAFFDATTDNMQTTCMQEVTMNSTFHRETGEESILDKVFKIACPSGCRGKGDCVDGQCKCHANYSGSDCSVDLNSPPQLTEVDFDGLCDVNEDPCTAISLVGGTFVNSASTACRFRDVVENGSPTMETSDGPVDASVVTASFENLFELSCRIPVRRTKRSALGVSAEDKPSAYHVSVSNNGVAYSEERIVVIYNSTCQTCTLSGTTVSCVISDEYCTLGTQCIPKGGMYPGGGCLVCDINGKEKSWQEGPTCSSCTRTSVTWILTMLPVYIIYYIFCNHIILY
ncbi:von Willebrand factor D and EGF domain-containing protein-like [Gigantopelta aegis]|uniref:von Willebrand factor D and EGF domain-containing protein-like n=1 Tax=Gigantopelta aegis TaxID=1735272 RepID=UPI001B88E22C|nr:von Willebrand factor D and EGF domain-containing protein-like [Gigantopelta aegis]